jgi:predicted component of type VI protein secretion system
MFRTEELPIHLGRVDDAQFVVNDPRVSRLHARIELRQGSCVLIDVSTYGTWVRFHGNGGPSTEIALRREECVLHGRGEIGLGAPLSDFSAPTIAFNTNSGDVMLSRREIAG